MKEIPNQHSKNKTWGKAKSATEKPSNRQAEAKPPFSVLVMDMTAPASLKMRNESGSKEEYYIVPSRKNGNIYALYFTEINDYKGWTHVEFLKEKSQILQAIQNVIVLIANMGYLVLEIQGDDDGGAKFSFKVLRVVFPVVNFRQAPPQTVNEDHSATAPVTSSCRSATGR